MVGAIFVNKRTIFCFLLCVITGIGCGGCPDINEMYLLMQRQELASVGVGAVDLAHPNHIRIDVGSDAWQQLVMPLLETLELSTQRLRQPHPMREQTIVVTETSLTLVDILPTVGNAFYEEDLALHFDISLRVRVDAPGGDDNSYALTGNAVLLVDLATSLENDTEAIINMAMPTLESFELNEQLLPEPIEMLILPVLPDQILQAIQTLPMEIPVFTIPMLEVGYSTIQTALTDVSVREDTNTVVFFITTGLRELEEVTAIPSISEGIIISWSPSMIASIIRALLVQNAIPQRYENARRDSEGDVWLSADRSWGDDGLLWLRYDLWCSNNVDCYKVSMTIGSDISAEENEVILEPIRGNRIVEIGHPPNDLNENWHEGDFSMTYFLVIRRLLQFDPFRADQTLYSNIERIELDDDNVSVMRNLIIENEN